ncbi:MAG TPA: Uma2 family endonuclease [Pyrinomonadaceae bacterium]|nr:Uma2 family endonuclease [Pyrinomonadaceae bacterium]
MTYEEFLEKCDATHAEWVDGEVILMSPPSTRHQRLVLFLCSLLQLYVEAHELGLVLVGPFQMKLAFRPSGREPDVLFVAQQRVSLLKKNYLDGPADLAIEVMSPDSHSRDRIEKFAEYEQAGVREYWLLDPETRRAGFFVLSEAGAYDAKSQNEAVYRSMVLEGLWMKVDWFWQEPLPQLMSILKEWGLIKT